MDIGLALGAVTARGWLHNVPLTGRVLAVVVVALLPLLAALVVDTYNDEQDARAGIATRTRDLEARVAVREESMLAEMHGFLRPLTALPQVREGSLGECAPILQGVRGEEPRLAALAVYQGDQLLCRGDGLLDAAPFLDDAVLAASSMGGFAITAAAWDERIQDWVVPFAVPVGPDAPDRIVAGAMHLEILRNQLSGLADAEGIHILMFSPTGDLLVDTAAIRPEAARALFEEATQSLGSWRASPDGEPFVYTVRTTLGADGEVRALIVAGLPLGPAEAATSRLLVARAALGGSALVLGGVLAAWIMAVTVRDPLRAVEDASRRVTAGDLSARMEVPRAPREFRALETSFNTMAEALDGLENTRAELFNHVSHQVRTPLTRLILSQEVLRIALESGNLDAARRNAATGLRATEELRVKTEKLDALAQVLLAQRRTTFHTLSLEEIANEVRQAATQQTPEHSLIVRVEGNPEAAARVHPPSLRRAVQELIENAQRYGGPGAGHVLVQATPTDLRIEVHDQGPGLPAHAVAALHTPLMEGHSADVADTGFGVGLRLARLVVQLFGGRLEVSNGPGATVTMILPRID